MPPADTAAFMPRAVAVALPAEVHAQSIAPVWPVARAAALMKGLSVTVAPEICGTVALYVNTITPVPAVGAMFATYLVWTKAAFHAFAAALTPAMSFDWKPSAMATLADDAEPRPSVTFARTV